ncbi:MAG: PAS domain S-box protein [Candidatus Delongbacteria bacterium]|nr:PAS domain S-box protein [Candidatus Delongbacteria bacterium]
MRYSYMNNTQNIINTAGVIILSLDLEANILSFNKFSEEFTDYKIDEVIGQNWFELFIPKRDQNKIPGVFFDVLKEMGKYSNYENPILCKDGSEKIISWNNSLIYDEENHISGMLCIGIDVTEQRKTENELYLSEEKFRTLIQNNEEIIYMIDKNGIFTLSEGKGLSALGVAPGEVVGKSVYDLYKDSPEIFEDYKKVFKGESITCNLNIGGVYFRNWYTPHRDSNNEIIGLMGMSVNITESKKNEKALAASDSKLKKAELNAKFGYWEIDINSNAVNLSDGAKEIFGIEDNEINLTMMRNIPLEKYRISNTIAFNELVRNDVPYNVEYEFKTKGSEDIKRINSTATYSKNKNAVFGIVKDITERKISEEILAESEKHYRQLFEMLPYGCEVLDTQGTIIDCNKNTAELLGYEKDEIIGEKMTNFVNADTVKIFKENFPKVMNGESISVDACMVHKNGGNIFVRRTASPIRDSNGKIKLMLGLSINMTEKKLAEEELSKHRQHLEEVVKERTLELEQKNKDLEKYNDLFIGREHRIKELRDEIKRLEDNINK